MSVVNAIAYPSGQATIVKNQKVLRNLLEECRLTVRSIKCVSRNNRDTFIEDEDEWLGAQTLHVTLSKKSVKIQ